MNQVKRVMILASWYPSPMWPNLGGFIKKQAEALARSGFIVDVLYPNLYSPKRILKQKKLLLGFRRETHGKVLCYSLYGLKTHIRVIDRLLLLLMGKMLFKKYARANPLPDIVHLHVFIAGEIAMWIKETYGVPFVVTEHFTGFARNIISPAELKLAKKVYQNSSLNLAVSEPFQGVLLEKTGISFQILPNMIDTNFFQPPATKLQKESFTYINIADLVAKKNQSLLLEAFALLYQNNRNLRLLFVGDGQDRKLLEKKAEHLKLSDAVTFTGRLSKEGVLSCLQTSSCLVLPSQFETFGIVVIEALACGLPVVATPSGGPEWIFSLKGFPHEAGILAEPTVESLVKSMKRMLEVIPQKNILHDWVEQNFSEHVVIAHLTNIYQSSFTFNAKSDNA